MTLVFDYDGTLHDTKRLYGCALRKVYAHLVADGYAQPRELTDDGVSKYLGVNAPDMWNDFMPQLPDEIKRRSSGEVGDQMVESVLHGEARLFDGVTEMLDALKAAGYRMVILSNCRVRYMDAHRQRFGLDRWFDDYFCAEAYDFIPKQDIFPLIRQKYGGGFIMIGDRDSDFLVGTTHGFPVIGCAYGFGTAGERSVCDAVADFPADIPALISEFSNELLR